MRLLLLTLLFSFPALAGQSSALMLRARVPAVYRLEITSTGSLVTHSNQVGRAPKATVHTALINGVRFVTVTHP